MQASLQPSARHSRVLLVASDTHQEAQPGCAAGGIGLAAGLPLLGVAVHGAVGWLAEYAQPWTLVLPMPRVTMIPVQPGKGVTLAPCSLLAVLGGVGLPAG